MKKGQVANFQDHATKEWKVANFHGQASDVYAFV
jgi:hypothetical protein